MYTRAHLGLCLLLLLSQSNCFGQGNSQRDQQALRILAQAIAVAGGQESLASIQDLSEVGTMTFFFEEQLTGSVTIKERGLKQLRMDVDLPEGRRTTIVDGGGGWVRDANGQSLPISRQIISDLRSVTFPYLHLIVLMQNPSTKILYRGITRHDGIPAYHIRFERGYTFRQDSFGDRGEREGRDVYIDSNSFLVCAIADQIHFSNAGNDGLPHEVRYSNYHVQEGISVPLTISESTNGVTQSTLQVDHASFNTGITDSDFAE